MISWQLLSWDLQFETESGVKRLGSGRTPYMVAVVVNMGSGPVLRMVVVSVHYLSFPVSGLCDWAWKWTDRLEVRW